MTPRPLFILTALVGVPLPLVAQDSVAPPKGSGLRSDALDAYRTAGTSEQINDYVVDLAPITSSWGNRFAIGPVVKSSRSTVATSANHLVATQTLAPSLLGGPLARTSYTFWTLPGEGVNASVNTPSGAISTPGLRGQRTALAFLEFGAGPDAEFGSGDDEQNVVAARIDFQSRRPNRLFVSRVAAAHNKASAATGNSATASFGLGGVDHEANVALVADGFGVLSPSRLLARNYYRVAAASRDPSRVNRLQQSGPGDAAASARVLETITALMPPALIPSATVGRPLLIGAAFNTDYIFEASPGAVSTSRDYLPDGAGSPRGSISFDTTTFTPFGASTAGVGALLTRLPGEARTRSISLFGVNADGSVAAQRRVTLPLSPGGLADPVDPFDPGVFFPDPNRYGFSNFHSQTGFRGGAPVALTTLPSGDLLAAATISFPATEGDAPPVPQGELNAIVVVRVSATDSTASWTIAAHTGGPDGVGSKPIRGDYGADGIPGTNDAGEGDTVVDAAPIGRVALASERAPGAVTGPSLSSPAIDSDGNIYLLAESALNTPSGERFTTALLRAVRSPLNDGYTLELLAETGQVVPGLNAGREYRIESLAIADGDSVSSGAVAAGNISRGRIDGSPAGALPQGSRLSLGLLAVRAKIVYDADGDGAFVDPETPGAPPGDQSYHVVLALMPHVAPADFNRDDAVNSQDFFDFLAAFFGQGAGADYNGSGAADSQDFFDFLSDFFAQE